MAAQYELCDFCELIHTESAKVIGVYESDFYQGRPVFTVNEFGRGRAFCLAASVDEKFLKDFCAYLARELSLRRAPATELPQEVTAQVHSDGINDYLFLLNLSQSEQNIELGCSVFLDKLSNKRFTDKIDLKPFEVKMLV